MSNKNSWFEEAQKNINKFISQDRLGLDPFAQVYEQRRKEFSLFSLLLSEKEIESARNYIFNYDKLPQKPGDKPVDAPNLICGKWRMAKDVAEMKSPADKRIILSRMPDSDASDVEDALSYAQEFWKSQKWSEDTVIYRKHVVKNFSKILHYFYEDVLREIRTQIPKTRIEADKDFWEAKRAADHMEGSAERAMSGDVFPSLVEGHSYWKSPNLPAGVSAIFTPMNFIYGIPVIQFIGAYLVGSPFIFKGHPLGAIANTTMMRMLMAAGANPRSVQKIEGFGKKIENLVSDKRVAIVSVTGSDATAERMQSLRGVRPVRFEGGGSNWAWVDDGFSDEELKRIAIRLTYSKLGFSSHKCTSLHGIAASKATADKLLSYINSEMDEWKIQNPQNETAQKIVGPCMVHQAQTATDIQEAAAKIGARIYRKGGKVTSGEYAENAEVIAPVVISGVIPGMKVTVNWDGRGEKVVDLMTTEFFMPILVVSEMKNFDAFSDFCLNYNPHDLAVSIWTRDHKIISKVKSTLAGMVKINDGTDSALEWEEFGASGIGTSGNMGVGDPVATFAIYSRKQKGRQLVF
ncbi:MAG: aldehyde dehydrogenase family protein [Bacteriovoracia bacterium]